MEEERNSDVKSAIQLLYLEEKPDIQNLQQIKEDVENFDSQHHSMSEIISDQNLNSMEKHSLIEKEYNSDRKEHLKSELNEHNSDCFVYSEAHVHEHPGSIDHIQSYVNTQAVGIKNCINTEAYTQRLDGIEDYKSGIISQNFGIYTEDIKSEVYTETCDGVVGYDSEGNVQTFDRTEQKISEVYDVKCIDNIHPKSPAENFGGIKHLKPELRDETFDDVTDEKPCIAALRASVAAYSVDQGRKETELEPFPDTEMSSQEMLEPHCGTASNAQDQESVDNCPTDARTSERKELERKKCVEHSDKGKSSECPETLNEYSQGAELKYTTTNKVSQWQQEILLGKTSTDGPFPCFWCPCFFFQFVDCERHMKRSHREEYGKLLQEKCFQHMKGLHPKNGLHPCRTSSSPQSGKSLQIAQHKSSESCCDTKSEKTFIKTETPIDMDKLQQNEQARLLVASNYISKQVCKRFCSMLKSKDHKIHTGETRYKCDVCDKEFRHSRSVYAHMRIHTGEKPYNCDVCGKGFGQKCKLAIHKRTHTGEKPCKCNVCGKGFRNSSNLCGHKKIHTGQTPYKCDVCGKGFGRKGYLSVHMRTHTGEKPYKCDVCGKGFRDSSSFSVHKRTHTVEIPYRCDVCGKGFRDSSSFSVHKRTHTGETPYKCDVCGKGFRDSSTFSVHKRTHTGETPYKCDVCGKGFGRKYQLSPHKRTHTGETPYMCAVCGKGFGRKDHLSIHMRIHTGETPYKCDMCGKKFKQKGRLSEHKRIHTGETPYKCDVCGKGFGQKCQLTIHKRTHTGEKPYKCNVCGKGFRNNSNLWGHKKIHTGETPYKCDLCGKGFGRKGYLSVHMRTHTGEKPYKCNVCGKSFRDSSSFSVHKRTHTGETPYMCDVCGKGFRDSSNFSVHKRTHTGEMSYKKI